MLENNLHPDVAEKPEELIVYGGIGKAARDREATTAIVRELQRLGDDETLLVQSGKPVAVFETHPGAPRVLIANSNLVPEWATWRHFRELDAAGLMMYGQMTAGSWIYIGSQGILQGTYETFAAAARQALRRVARRPARGHRGAGRHGRRAAAGGDDVRAARRCASRSTSSASSGGSRRATSTSAPARWTTRWRGWTPPAASGGRCRSACSATPPRCCRSWRAAARRSTW